MDNQQRLVVKDIELYLILCTSLGGMGVRGHMDTLMYMAESLRSLPETVTIFLIDCTLIQNVFGVKK